MRSFGDDDLSNSAGRSLVNCFMTIPINIQHEILGFVCDVRVILSCSQHYSASNSLFNPPSFQTTLVSKTNTNKQLFTAFEHGERQEPDYPSHHFSIPHLPPEYRRYPLETTWRDTSLRYLHQTGDSDQLEMQLFARRMTEREAMSVIPSSNDWIRLELAWSTRSLEYPEKKEGSSVRRLLLTAMTSR